MKTVLAVVSLVAVLTGCASGNQSPTHRWVSTEAANEIEYRRDNLACSEQANLDPQAAQAQDTEAFQVYQACMTARGYQLTAQR